MNYSPRTRSRVRAIESNAASRFDSTILSNVIYDRIGEDEQLKEMIEASERCIIAQDMRLTESSDTLDSINADLDRAADSIDSLVSTRVDETVEEILESLNSELDDWSDTWSESQIDDAQAEMKTYLNGETDPEPTVV